MPYQNRAYVLVQINGLTPKLVFSSRDKIAGFIARHEQAIGDWQVYGSDINETGRPMDNFTMLIQSKVRKIQEKEGIIGSNPLPALLELRPQIR